jgi:hypothetical protein
MNTLAQNKLDGSTLKGVRLIALLATAVVFAACDGAGQGVQLGNGQSPDPVVIDYPIAYIKSPLPVDDNGDLVQSDLREQITFDFGADLYVKDRASPSSPAINVTGDLMQGLAAVRDVEMAFDGSAVIFAMRGPVDLNLNLDDDAQPTWDIWEYNFESAALRRIIPGDVTAELGHDVAPHYLPDGRIIFSSTRQRRSKAILVDEIKPQFAAQDEDVNEDAFLLHIMDADGDNIQQVTFNQSHDIDPAVLSTGQIVFTRWDHAGRNNVMNLYRMNPDGSQLELLYGQNSHDTGTGGQIIHFTQPRELEDGRIMALIRPFTGSNGGGDIITIDTPTYLENTQPTKDNAGMAGPAQARATIVNVNTVPGEVSPGGRYNSVYPIQDGTGRILVSWSQCRLTDIVDPAVQPPLAVIYYPCTDENLINSNYVEADPIYGIWIYDPRDQTQLPIVPPEEGFIFTEVASADPRPTPPLILDLENRFNLGPDIISDGEAVISIRNVYDFDGTAILDIDALADPAQTTADQRPARFLRVVKAVSLPDEDDLELENEAFGPNRNLGMKEIVGYGMIEPDGSVMLKVPANTALQVSVLDGNGRRITPRHQNWLQLRPGQLLECNGCHIAQGGLSHGRFDAFDSAYAGTTAAPGAPFNPNTVNSLFVGDTGETMAEVRARISCSDAGDPCYSIKPSMDIEYQDVWTDEIRAGRQADPSFSYSYQDLMTTAPTSDNCILQGWAAKCRTVVNYETHIHPLWTLVRPVIDPNTGMQALDPVTGLPLTNTCTDCHTAVDAAGAQMVPAGQLELTDGLDILVPEHFHSYEELLFQDEEVTLDANGVLVPVMVVIGQDANGNDILAPATVNPSMSAGGANASDRFFSRFDSAVDMHSGYLSDAEKRLIAEWLDVGAQYYNNPFVVPIN